MPAGPIAFPVSGFKDADGTTVNDIETTLTNSTNHIATSAAIHAAIAAVGGETYTQTVIDTGSPALSLNFDGYNDHVSIPSSTDFDFGAGDFTVECMVKAKTLTGHGEVIQRSFVDDANAASFRMRIGDSGSLSFFVQTSTPSSFGVVEAPTGTITVDTWHHLAYTRMGNTFTGYIDGVAFDTATSSETIGVAAGSLEIGRKDSNQYYFDGCVNEVRILKGYCFGETDLNRYKDVILSASRASQLTAYYSMNSNGGTGATLTDDSGNGHTGTLINMTNDDWVEDSGLSMMYQLSQTDTGKMFRAEGSKNITFISHSSTASVMNYVILNALDAGYSTGLVDSYSGATGFPINGFRCADYGAGIKAHGNISNEWFFTAVGNWGVSSSSGGVTHTHTNKTTVLDKLPVPSSGDDAKALVWDDGTSAFVYATTGSSGTTGTVKTRHLVSASMTLDDTHEVLVCPATGTYNLTLPLASTCPGRVYYVTNDRPSGGAVLALVRSGSDTIKYTLTTLNIVNMRASAWISDGVSNWNLLLFAGYNF